MGSPQRVNQVEFWQLVQVEDSGGEASDQDVGGFVEGSSGQIVEVAIFVEKVSESIKTGQIFPSERPDQRNKNHQTGLSEEQQEPSEWSDQRTDRNHQTGLIRGTTGTIRPV